MASVINFKRTMERKDYKQAKQAMFLYRNRYLLLVVGVLFAFGVYSLVQALSTGSIGNFMTALILMVALPCSFFFLYRKNVVQKGNTEDFVEETVITIDTGYITARVAVEEARQLMVSQLKKAVETRRFFFLFSTQKSAVILTKKDMDDAQQQFLKMILDRQIGRDFKRFPV